MKIEYMDNGYFESAIEYNADVDVMCIAIGDFAAQTTTCFADDKQVELLPTHVYSASELTALNVD